MAEGGTMGGHTAGFGQNMSGAFSGGKGGGFNTMGGRVGGGKNKSVLTRLYL